MKPVLTQFTEQQAGRMHCWLRDVLIGWIACTANEDCDDRDDCTQDVCDEGVCQNNWTCYCDDNGGESPFVCVTWNASTPPVEDVNFVVTPTDPTNPDVTFVTGNEGWQVWSQVSETNEAPANLGHIKIDPTVATANFGVKISRVSSPGAANVASISLVDTGWTGRSSLFGSVIAGNLAGELVVQESGGNGGSVSLIIGGDVDGDITIPNVNRLEIGGSVSTGASIAIGNEISGDAVVLVQGALDGNVCAANLSGTKPLPPNVQINTIGANAEICGVAAASCSSPQSAPGIEPSGVKRNRFISLVPGNNSGETAIAVNLDSLHHPAAPENHPDFSDSEEQLLYVNAFRDSGKLGTGGPLK